MTTPISSPTVANPVEFNLVLTLNTLMHSATSPPELSMIYLSVSSAAVCQTAYIQPSLESDHCV
jgi:hypothetical protein